MAKMSTLKNKIATVNEGKYTATIISVASTDKMLYENQPNILTIKLTELNNRIVKVFLNTTKENADDVSIYERTMFDIYEQLQSTADIDTDLLEDVNEEFRGKCVNCYVVHATSDTGETYTNYYFNAKNNKVRAMLEMM